MIVIHPISYLKQKTQNLTQCGYWTRCSGMSSLHPLIFIQYWTRCSGMSSLHPLIYIQYQISSRQFQKSCDVNSLYSTIISSMIITVKRNCCFTLHYISVVRLHISYHGCIDYTLKTYINASKYCDNVNPRLKPL